MRALCGALFIGGWLSCSASSSPHSPLPPMLQGGYSGPSISLPDEVIEISNSNIPELNGQYVRDEDIRGRPHFKQRLKKTALHLYWTGTQWVLHYDTNPSLNMNHMLAYTKASVRHPQQTTKLWYVRKGNSFQPFPQLEVHDPTKLPTAQLQESLVPHTLGVPRRLLPLYLAFMSDAIAVGLAMPLLPFYVMELGANAFQLSLIVSSNYFAQMIGCLVVGQISDRYGRKLVLSTALFMSFVSYFGISQSTKLSHVTLARLLIGACGGLVPIVQSSVADVTSDSDRPKYFARIMATYGMGFVLGPACSALLTGVSTKQKLMLASFFPLTGFIVQLLFFKETKQDIAHLNKGNAEVVSVISKTPINTKVLMLLVNGFLLMYAFSIETIYAMFLKDNFGYGERALSTLFACNGILIGIFQIFFIKPLVAQIGKHWTLITGNAVLSLGTISAATYFHVLMPKYLGMIGLSLVRNEPIHFTLFVMHIVGYSIADTALASLISKYSTPSSQGRDLAYNQAAQACARIVSPLIAGLLYEMSKKPSSRSLPIGALPYLVGSLFTAAGVLVPLALYSQSIRRKKSFEEEAISKKVKHL